MSRENIIERFVKFFVNYADGEGNKVYMRALTDILTVSGERVLPIDYSHLLSFDPELAEQLLNDPEEVLSAVDDAVATVLRNYLFLEELPKIEVGVFDLPRVKLPRHVDSSDVLRLVSVEGIVTRVSEIKPFVERAVFTCKDCGREMVRIQFPHEDLSTPGKCDACGSRDIFLNVKKSQLTNYQILRIQDPPETVNSGAPRYVDCIATGPLVERVSPGDRVRVTGILQVILEQNGKKPTFKKILELVHIEKLTKNWDEVEVSEDDIRRFEAEVQRPDFEKRF